MTTVEPYLSFSQIEEKTRAVRQRWEMLTLPVDPLAIARREGIEVFSVGFVDTSLSGSISVDEAGTKIQINREDPPMRKRFTLAHELGHYYLHLRDQTSGTIRQFTDGTNNLFRQPSKARGPVSDETRREYQANLFAASLLMPEEKVRSYWESVDSISELARLFEVSDLAMSIRLGQLGLLDADAK